MGLYFIQNAYFHFVRPDLLQEFVTNFSRALHIPWAYKSYLTYVFLILEVLGALLILSPKRAYVRQGSLILIGYLLSYNFS